MKMYFAIAVIIMFAISGTAFADFSSIPSTVLSGPSTAVVSLSGQSGKTKDIYIDNSAKTMRTLYENSGGSWLRGGATATETIAPIGMLLSCESKNIRFGFGGSVPTVSTLHVFFAGGSWILLSPTDIAEGYWIAGGATDNVQCAATPKY